MKSHPPEIEKDPLAGDRGPDSGHPKKVVYIEEARRESDDSLKTIFNNVNAVIVRCDKYGKITEINSKVEEFYGFKREDVLGKHFTKLGILTAKDLPKMVKLFADAIRGKQLSYHDVLETRDKSGNKKYVDVNCTVIKRDGKIDSTISIIHDVTERRKTEEALRISEHTFSQVFHASPNPICVISIEGETFIDINESYSQFTGYTREETIGRTLKELGLWVNQDDLITMRSILMQKGRMSNRQFSSRMKSGEIRTGLFSAEISNIAGKPCMVLVITDITEQKWAEDALKESEEFTSSLLTNTPNPIFVTYPDSAIKYVNPAFEKLTGYSLTEIIGMKTPYPWWPPETRDEIEAKLRESTFDNGSKREMAYQKKSRERFWVELNATMINKNGEREYILVNWVDITERKQMETALRESEEKFSKAFNASANAISITSLKTKLNIDVNESFTRFTGYTREEVVGHKTGELDVWVNPEEKKLWTDTIQKEGKVINQEFSSRMKSGEIRFGLGSSDVINIGGELCRIAVITDITERKKAEEGLRLLSSVTQQVTDSIVVTDPEFKITYMNKAAQDLFGYSIYEALGKDSVLFDAAPLPKSIRKDIMDAVKTGKTWTAVLTKRRKDGSTFLCDCRRSPLFDEDGRLASYFVVYRDITEQKETEAKLKAQKLMVESILTAMPEGVLVTDSSDRIMLANESFRRIFHTGRSIIDKKLVNEVLHVEQLTDLYASIKTGDTASHSLEFRYKVKETEKIIACVIVKMDSERMLLIFSDVSRERDEEDKMYLTDRLASLGVMAAGLAHELNNPLTGILTLSQLLVNSDLPDEHKEDLQCIYSEAKRAANIVKNVLLFTRNNSYENGQSSVNEVAKEVLRLREHEEKVKNINVVTNFQDNLPEIQLDKYQLQQVFLNIILNAEAAIEEANRPGTLTVTTEKVNNHVNIIFSDTGCGIKKNILPRIFDPFFTTKEIGKGTGLGLSICYGIIVKHNGKISVKTQVGKGTTFSIRMPIVN